MRPAAAAPAVEPAPIVRSRIGPQTMAAPGRAAATPRFATGAPTPSAPPPKGGRLSPATVVLAVVFGAVLTGAAFGVFLLLR
jgi:hypothetical protein